MNALRTLLVLVATSLVFACSQNSGNGEADNAEVLGPGEVAFVNGERIPESVFRLHTLSALQVNADDLTPEAREEMIEQLVLLQLLAGEAETNGLHRERRIAAELELQRIQFLARAMAERYTEDNPPSEAELRELYELNLPRLRAAQYKTRHILVDSETLAIDLIEQLNEGADFAALATEHSTDSSTSEDGDLGWLTADSVVEPFATAIQAATPGELLDDPIETQYGWHVILVDEVQEQVAPGLESVRQDLIRAVETQKLDTYASGLRETAEVTMVGE